MKTAMVLVVITFCFAVAEFARPPNPYAGHRA
jgi:hypothetical protein